MKTRENELHEPIIGTGLRTGDCIGAAKCAVCCFVLAFEVGRNQGEAAKNVEKKCPNYCPHCGARLKEVDE